MLILAVMVLVTAILVAIKVLRGYSGGRSQSGDGEAGDDAPESARTCCGCERLHE
jgi:hypothetical protein